MSHAARIQLARTGATIDRDPAALAAARREFDTTHALRFPAFIDAALLAEVQAQVAAGVFHTKVHKSSGVESCMAPNAAVWLLRFLIVSDDVLRAVETITGVDDLRSFFGRVYRFDPGTDHHHDWHDDLGDGRALGFSLNLSPVAFAGGALQLRERDPERITATIFNTTPGDAVLFRLANNVEHQVQRITGTVPRTTFAGWFRGGPDAPAMPRTS
jgi:hypothetical protein